MRSLRTSAVPVPASSVCLFFYARIHLPPFPPAELELRCDVLSISGGRSKSEGLGQPPGEEVVGYDLQVVQTAGTLGPVASGDVPVPYNIDCTHCTLLYRSPERLYPMCYI